MECSTKSINEQELRDSLEKIEPYPLIQQDWEKVQEKMGVDLELTARETKAIQRMREIRNGKDLLRLNLFYAMSDWGLRLTGAWALICGIGVLSDVAILKRIRHSQVWLGKLVGMILAKRCTALRSLPGVRLRLLDATCLNQPGSKGTDWRIHLSFDIGNLCVDRIEVTDRHGGESFARFMPQDNEILIGDGGYAFASGMGPVLASGAGLVVRINWQNMKVYTPDRQRFQIIPWLKTLSAPCEQAILFETPQGWFPLRIIAAPIPAEKAETARRKARERCQKKQKTVSQETLFAAGFVLLLTNLSTSIWPTHLVLFLYRSRWQIEILFKRLKSHLHFDHLRAKDPQLAQSYIFSKLLIALIIDQMIYQASLIQPDWFISLDRPANLSRLTSYLHESLRQIIFGPWLLNNISRFLLIMRRYFCDSPRSRPQLLAFVRAIFQHISFSSYGS